MSHTQNGPPKVGRAASVSLELGSRERTEVASLSKSHLIEDDDAFFRARPDARTRIRLPFPHEFPPELLHRGDGRQAVVIVVVSRNPFTGEVINRARGLALTEGGRS